MSAPFLYARLLNGFSPFNSSRSAVSLRMRAMGRLSNAQALCLDGEIEDSGAPARQRLAHGVTIPRRAVAEEAPATTGSTDLGSGRTCGMRSRDQAVDGGRCHARSQLLAVLPLDR